MFIIWAAPHTWLVLVTLYIKYTKKSTSLLRELSGLDMLASTMIALPKARAATDILQQQPLSLLIIWCAISHNYLTIQPIAAAGTGIVRIALNCINILTIGIFHKAHMIALTLPSQSKKAISPGTGAYPLSCH